MTENKTAREVSSLYPQHQNNQDWMKNRFTPEAQQINIKYRKKVPWALSMRGKDALDKT